MSDKNNNMTVVVNMTQIKRANNSVNGNPRWKITADNNEIYYTEIDASLAYGLSNSDVLGPADIVNATPRPVRARLTMKGDDPRRVYRAEVLTDIDR